MLDGVIHPVSPKNKHCTKHTLHGVLRRQVGAGAEAEAAAGAEAGAGEGAAGAGAGAGADNTG